MAVDLTKYEDRFKQGLDVMINVYTVTEWSTIEEKIMWKPTYVQYQGLIGGPPQGAQGANNANPNAGGNARTMYFKTGDTPAGYRIVINIDQEDDLQWFEDNFEEVYAHFRRVTYQYIEEVAPWIFNDRT